MAREGRNEGKITSYTELKNKRGKEYEGRRIIRKRKEKEREWKNE